MDVAPLAADDVKRAAQLTLRTNQFNFTTIRREARDVQALAAAGRHDIRTVRVRDRFGDYGLVGLLIAEKSADVWTLDTFLLSCRVLGRGVEHRVIATLGAAAAAAGARAVRLRLETTKRNTPARTFLRSIAPPALLEGDDNRLECTVPVEALASVAFTPDANAEAPSADAAEGRPAASGIAAPDSERLRRRERQIARAAFTLNTGAAIRQAIGGSVTEAAPAVRSDLASIVHAAFAAALKIPAAQVAEVDRLEALGCDSLRIVEITVALHQTFPWLPGTLLFEHRSVGDIVREITRLSGATDAGASIEPAAGPAARSIQPVPSGARRDIAIVGMHARCAAANSPDELWDLLSQGQSAVGPVPPHREFFLQPLNDTRPHWAGLLDDVARFDAELFGVSPREAEFMDPQLRLFLEVAWNALEDAGALGADHDPSTGVFAGVMYGDYGLHANLAPSANRNAYRCWEGFSLANRLSQLLGFGGPSLAIDTACSSSATALHLACAALRAGDCRVAVVGGVNLLLDPDRFASLGRLGILSERGRCEPFGADADGTVMGEGAGVVVLRPLDEAIERGDRIYGVIKGTALSTGNGTVGFTAPNPQAQAEAIRRSLAASGVDPRTISYVETHGTGTGLGDPIEVRGLTLGYGAPELRDPALETTLACRIGSIKPNIGHLEAGAGVLSLIKVLLQLQHGMLLPSVTSPEPNPQIVFASGTFDVQRTLEPWQRRVASVNGAPVTLPRRAGLSSFGVGGANAHIVIEEAPGRAATEARVERPAHLLALSGRTADALDRRVRAAARHFEESPEAAIADFCYSANTGRRHFEHRLAVPCTSGADLLKALDPASRPRRGARGVAGSTRPKIAFLFTGQGAQYAGMGRELYQTQPVFRDALDRCAALLDELLDRPLFDLLFATDGSPEADLIHQTGYTQPALFSFEYAMSALWQSWGITPDVVMGHSVGEIAALAVAGGVSLEDGVRLIAARGRLMQALPAGGTMTSVMADERRVIEALAGSTEVAIAAINAPAQIVISGAGAAVAEIAARLTADGVKTKALTVSHAFHSPLMRPMLAEYQGVVRAVRFTAPGIPLVSGVTGEIGTGELTNPEYWLRNVMDPVRFVAGMRALERERVNLYVEVGPHPVLLGMGRQCVEDESAAAWLPSVRKDGDNWQTLLGSAAAVYAAGAPLDWRGFDAPYARARVTVPPYEFGGRPHWLKRLRDVSHAPAAAPAIETDSRPALYEVAWRKQAFAGDGPVPARWVVFADATGVGEELALTLSGRGAAVTVVVPGTRFGESDGRFTIDPEKREDFDRVWASLGPGSSPARVAYLWSLDAEGRDVGSTARLSLARALALVQSLVASGRSHTVWFVTRDAVAIDGAPAGQPLSVAQGSIWGFARTVALEHPEIWGGILDVTAGATGVAALTRELSGNGAEDQVALRGGNRFVARLVRVPESGEAPPALDPDGTYLVTGGVGALGLRVAEWLVARGARHLVLSSRRAAVDEAALARIGALEEAGASITIAAADVSRATDVDALLERIADGGFPLRGIVHAAGVDTQQPIRTLTDEDVRGVLASKVDGACLLHSRTRELDLHLFVSFSSIASILGSQNRAHYAAANAALDVLAAERRRLGLAALTVNWGPWKGGGMATSPHLEQFERIGNRGLRPDDAVRALEMLLARGSAVASVADIDWTTFAPIYEARRARPILAEVSLEPGGQPAEEGPAGPDWVARLRAVAPERRAAELGTLLAAQVSETLGFEDPASVPLDRNFYEIGMDSLMMADLVAALKRHLGAPCAALVFTQPTVSALARASMDALTFDPAPVPAPAGGAAAAAPWAERLARAGAGDRAALLADLVRREVSETLGFDSPESVAVDRPFTELGMDSLLSAELGSRLKKLLGIPAARLVFEHPSVGALSGHLLGQVAIAAPVSAGAAAVVRPESSGMAAPYSPELEREAVEFQVRAWPHRDPALVPQRWHWMFVDSARRLGVEPQNLAPSRPGAHRRAHGRDSGPREGGRVRTDERVVRGHDGARGLPGAGARVAADGGRARRPAVRPVAGPDGRDADHHGPAWLEGGGAAPDRADRAARRQRPQGQAAGAVRLGGGRGGRCLGGADAAAASGPAADGAHGGAVRRAARSAVGRRLARHPDGGRPRRLVPELEVRRSARPGSAPARAERRQRSPGGRDLDVPRARRELPVPAGAPRGSRGAARRRGAAARHRRERLRGADGGGGRLAALPAHRRTAHGGAARVRLLPAAALAVLARGSGAAVGRRARAGAVAGRLVRHPGGFGHRPAVVTTGRWIMGQPRDNATADSMRTE